MYTAVVLYTIHYTIQYTVCTTANYCSIRRYDMYIMPSMEHDIKYLLWMYETRAYKDITFDMINTYRASITTAHFQRHIHILNMPYKVCFLSIVWKIPFSVHCTCTLYGVHHCIMGCSNSMTPYIVHFTGYGVKCIIYTLCIECTMYILLCKLHNVQFTMYIFDTTNSLMYDVRRREIVQSPFYSAQCTLCTVQYTLHTNVQCTLYSVH